LMMSLWDALRMNMMISYQELVRTFPNSHAKSPEFLSTASNFVVFFHYRNGVMAHCLIGRPYPDGSFGFSQTI
ncbi:hypothetical protein B8045_07375, partial [Klebsiella pneumoniae]|uniref:hypothetical protein n=4 Tax=Klebsiella TaxID=570 RepID=UPI000B6A8252